MTEEERTQIASFRFQVIAPLVTRELAPGEQAKILRELAEKSWDIPGSQRRRIHLRTLERYLALYRSGGFEALKPAARVDRGQHRVLDPAIVEKAVALRREVPTRSVEQIIQLLEWERLVEPGVLKRSTLSHQLVRHGASRAELSSEKEVFQRYEAPHRNSQWQGDTQYVLRLPDLKNPERSRQVYLIAFIDAYSRLVVSARMFFEENRPRLEETLRQGILAYGLPELLYTDNGQIYSSQYLERVCGELGVELRHSRPYRPQGRGKIEKWFQFVERSFTAEAKSLIDAGRLRTLEQLNEYFAAWLDVAYNRRKHSSTKEAPLKRWESCNHPVRRVDPERLREIFLWQEERRVDKTGVIHLAGNLYEVDLRLARLKVVLRYDPYDLGRILVEHEGKRYPDAVPVKLRHGVHREVPPPLPKPEPTGLSFLEAARRQHLEQLREEAGRLVFRKEDR